MTPQIPEMGAKELDLAARILCLALINTNAETLNITQENFHSGDEQFGDFQITVTRINTSEGERRET